MSLKFENSKEFEELVAQLLQLSGHDVSREQQCGAKRVDLIATQSRFGRLHRIAVECKNWSSALTLDDVSRIAVEYLSLYEMGDIDEVLILTRASISPSAVTFCKTKRGITHLTIADLQNQIIDFRPYLNGLIQDYEHDGLDTCYVAVRSTEKLDLEKEVEYWLERKWEDRPIAILGSYGLGKTTFARHLAYKLARLFRSDPTARIPIYLRLGDISSEQSLEGLLGKVFTAQTVIRNYSFPGFMALARAGRFVVLLDGFDEMKHTLTWDEFKFNFQQLNRMIVPNNRVVLLGRPSAFLSENEYQHALHGLRRVGDRQIAEAGWPDFQEIYIAPFAKEQVEEFLRKYIIYKLSPPASKKQTDHRMYLRLESQIEEVSSKRMSDIARRPVQLKMLAEVLPQFEGSLDTLTIAALYDYFIDLIIEREASKISRSRFSVTDRRKFATELAWWLWTVKKEMHVIPADLPRELIEPFVDDEADFEATTRDLVSACFLERKTGGALYFPHRSFQEFLVASEIAAKLTSEQLSLADADSLMTDEVADFMAGLIGAHNLKSTFARFHGTLSWRFVRCWMRSPELSAFHDFDIAWFVLLATLEQTTDKGVSGALNGVRERLLDAAKKHRNSPLALVCFLCILGLFEKLGGDRSRACADSIVKMLIVLKHRADLFGHLSVGRKKRENNDLFLNLQSVYPFLCTQLRKYCMVADWLLGNTIRTDAMAMPLFIKLSDEFVEQLQSLGIRVEARASTERRPRFPF